MFDYNYIIAPLLGALIGYITNTLAIRMLFRPHEAKYLFGIHIPFTPGIIPKEKGRIAQSIGQVVSDNLMNSEVLGNYLLTEEMEQKLRAEITSLLEGKMGVLGAVAPFIISHLTDKTIKIYRQAVEDHLPGILETIDISRIVCDRINEMDVAETEKLIMSVMKKELKAIEWLGALLGLLMGAINIFI